MFSSGCNCGPGRTGKSAPGKVFSSPFVFSNLAISWNQIGVAAVFLFWHCRAYLNGLNLSQDLEKVRDLYVIFSPFVPRATFFHVLEHCTTLQRDGWEGQGPLISTFPYPAQTL